MRLAGLEVGAITTGLREYDMYRQNYTIAVIVCQIQPRIYDPNTKLYVHSSFFLMAKKTRHDNHYSLES